MKYYFAPMEGITGHIYRNAYEKFFHNIDKYFTPFIIPNESKRLNTKELIDVLPENNKGISIVPQILTNDSEGHPKVVGGNYYIDDGKTSLSKIDTYSTEAKTSLGFRIVLYIK